MERIQNDKKYFSARTNDKIAIKSLSLDLAKDLFLELFEDFYNRDYFAEHISFNCSEHEEVYGSRGKRFSSHVLICLLKSDLWPIRDNLYQYNESDLFDMIELLYDNISAPITYVEIDNFASHCAHPDKYDERLGKFQYRQDINRFLGKYGSGYELSETGEILLLEPTGMSPLFDAQIKSNDMQVTQKIEAAISRFRSRSSSGLDRDAAVRDLADALEWLKPKIKKSLLSKDENDLFDLANNFGIRHHNQKQKINYDKNIWRSWMFYYYLATIHACLHLIEKQDSQNS